MLKSDEIKSMANAIRFLSIDAIDQANSGHPGLPLGMADVVAVLYANHMRFSPKDPKWQARDRFILSAGHGSALYYSLLYLLGYEITLEDIKNFRQLGSIAAGHPEFELLPSVETTTGPLGQGLANAVGIAIEEQMLKAKFGKEVIDYYSYVLVGDGCLMEGISHEAISLAGHLGLGNLIVFFDDNKMFIDGSTEITISDDYSYRFKASNWHYLEIDAYDQTSINRAIFEAKKDKRPSLIACKSKIGYGSPLENSSASHGAALGKKNTQATRDNLNWPHKEFEIPEEILIYCRKLGEKHLNYYNNWQKDHQDKFLPIDINFINKKLNSFKSELYGKNEPTRKSSGRIIEFLNEISDRFIIGSADLSESNNCLNKNSKIFNKNNLTGNFIHYGVREHAMAAIMNGIALNDYFIPIGGTFLVFSDYLRPALRLAAMMNLKIIYVFTHDSIGLGEDGPTHQPVEHLSSLRLIPNLRIYRPCDSIETIESWLSAINHQGPSALCLSRQGLINIREIKNENMVEKGAYEIYSSNKESLITIFSSGSEVSLAISVAKDLESVGIYTKVISIPCFEIAKNELIKYHQDKSFKVAIEAGLSSSYDKLINYEGLFFGVETFGKSGKIDDLYKYFGLEKDNIVKTIRKRLKL